MRHPANISALAQLKPDLMGFIFFRPSPRYVGPNYQVPELEGIAKVGVFVNAPISEIVHIASINKLDYIQLHGSETVADCEALKKEDFKLIKAFGISAQTDWQAPGPYAACCDYFLFDSRGAQRGGNGTKYEWKLLDNYKFNTPFFLSGGIEPLDAPLIRKLMHPQLAGVDINSRFEDSPAIKKIDMIQHFIHELRNETI